MNDWNNDFDKPETVNNEHEDLFIDTEEDNKNQPAPENHDGEVVTKLNSRDDGELFNWSQLADFGNFVLSMNNFTNNQKALIAAVADTRANSSVVEIAKKLYEEPGKRDSLDFLLQVLDGDPSDHVGFIDTIVSVSDRVSSAGKDEKRDIVRIGNILLTTLELPGKLTSNQKQKVFISSVVSLAGAKDKEEKLVDIKAVSDLLAIWPGKATR